MIMENNLNNNFDNFINVMTGSKQQQELERQREEYKKQRDAEFEEWYAKQHANEQPTQIDPLENNTLIEDSDQLKNWEIPYDDTLYDDSSDDSDQTQYEQSIADLVANDNKTNDNKTISDHDSYNIGLKQHEQTISNEDKKEFIEEQIETNPTEATEILDPNDNTELFEEATQVMDDNPHNDEVNNEALEVEEDKGNLDDLFSKFAENADENNNQKESFEEFNDRLVAGNITDKDLERYWKEKNYSDEDIKYLKVAEKLGPQYWKSTINSVGYEAPQFNEDGYIEGSGHKGKPVFTSNDDQALAKVRKLIESIPEYGKHPADLSIDDLKRAARQKRSLTLQEFGFSKDQARKELDYRRTGQVSIEDHPSPRWDDIRFAKYNKRLQDAFKSIDPRNPDSMKLFRSLSSWQSKYLKAFEQKRALGLLEGKDLQEIGSNISNKDSDQDIERKFGSFIPEVVVPIEEEINETSVNPKEVEQSILVDREKENKLYAKQQAEFQKKLEKAKLAEEKRINKEIAQKEKQAKNPKPEDKALAIYDPKAIMEIEQGIKETQKIADKKEEEIRKKWNLPKFFGNKSSSLDIPNSSSTIIQNKVKPFEGSHSGGSHSSSTNNNFPTGNRGAAINHDYTNTSKDLDIKTKTFGSSGGNTDLPKVEKNIHPAASTKSNQKSSDKPLGNIIGWSNVGKSSSNKISSSNSGHIPKISLQTQSQNGTKLSPTSKSNKNNITLKNIEQKIISSARSWPTNEKGYKSSGEKYLPFIFYVKDGNIEYSHLGTGATRRKNLNSASESELEMIRKII